MTADPHHRARSDIHDLLPDGWQVALPSYDLGRGVWEVVARSPTPTGRRGRPEYVEAQGEDELAALTYLVLALQDRRNAQKTDEVKAMSRAAYLEGAEEESRRTRGRGLTGEELETVIHQFPSGR